MKIVRIYIRSSTHTQDIERQKYLISQSKEYGYYIAGVYAEKASGASFDRPELNRMLDDLQPGDVILAEDMDRISRLPLVEAEKLIEIVKKKEAQISVPGLIDLSELDFSGNDLLKVVVQGMQEMLMRLLLVISRKDYEQRRARQKQGIELARKKNKFLGRQANVELHKKIIQLSAKGYSISQIAALLNCSDSTVKRARAKERSKVKEDDQFDLLNLN